MNKRDYDSTVARMAGNIAAGLVMHPCYSPTGHGLVVEATRIARAIIVEVTRTEPLAELTEAAEAR